MKKTVSINIAGMAYVIDDDAYIMLKNYLDDIASRGGDSSNELVADIESRLAEIFSERGADNVRVITVAMVNYAISLIGSPSVFGEKIYTVNSEESHKKSRVNRLFRNGSDKVIGGVCSGIAHYIDIDPLLMRIISFCLIFVSFGTTVLIYIILWIMLPIRYINRYGEVINNDN